MTPENLAAGETVIARESFKPSLVLFWLKTELSATEKRISGREANTVAGVIPAGSINILFPLKQVAGVQVESQLKLSRMLLGAALGAVGLLVMPSLLGVILLLVGAVLILGGLSASLAITNTAGQTKHVAVTIFEKARLEAFATTVSHHMLSL